MEAKEFFSRHPFFHFAWPVLHHANLLLPLCLLIATLLHVGAIFLFEISYKEEGGTLPRPADVAVLFSNSPEYRKIAGWLSGNDPSLLSATDPDTIDFQQVFQTPYWPTFDLATTHLQPSPMEQSTQSAQEVVLPEDIVSNLVSNADAGTASLRAAIPTRVEFQDAISGRTPENLPSAPNSTQSAEPAIFLTGVLGDGQVGFIYPQKESGIPELDQQAIDYLRRLRMKKSANADIQWGMVTFHWGIAPARP